MLPVTASEPGTTAWSADMEGTTASAEGTSASSPASPAANPSCCSSAPMITAGSPPSAAPAEPFPAVRCHPGAKLYDHDTPPRSILNQHAPQKPQASNTPHLAPQKYRCPLKSKLTFSTCLILTFPNPFSQEQESGKISYCTDAECMWTSRSVQ